MEIQMKNTIVFLAMSSCFILGTSIAHADSDSSQGRKDDKIFKIDQKMFKAMDKDSNGKVTQEEFKTFTKQKDVKDFNVWDVDGNGDIDSWEMKIVAQRNESERNSGGSSGEAGKMDNAGDTNSDSSRDRKRDDASSQNSDNTRGGSSSRGGSSGGDH
jgi:hypothetical protein